MYIIVHFQSAKLSQVCGEVNVTYSMLSEICVYTVQYVDIINLSDKPLTLAFFLTIFCWENLIFFSKISSTILSTIVLLLVKCPMKLSFLWKILNKANTLPSCSDSTTYFVYLLR